MDIKNLLSFSEAAKELKLAPAAFQYWLTKLCIEPDCWIPFGKKKMSFLSREDIDKVREARRLSKYVRDYDSN